MKMKRTPRFFNAQTGKPETRVPLTKGSSFVDNVLLKVEQYKIEIPEAEKLINEYEALKRG